MAKKVRELTLANVDLDDPQEMAELLRQDLRQADARIKEAVQRMRQQGLIDAEGRRLRTELPTDMLEDSSTDFGG
jgi:hypothetical protein